MTWFTTKKVEGSAILSEKLASIRKEKNIDLDTLSEKTKISKKYLVYLEEGKLEKLPAEIYVKGFLKKIAAFYLVNPQVFLPLYGQEENIRKNIDRSKYPPFNFNHAPTFIITPRLFMTIGVGVVIIAFLFFIVYQLSFAVRGPSLVVDFPRDGMIVDTAEIVVRGLVDDSDTVVTINGEKINLQNGKIYETVRLNLGLNIVRISATNKFKKNSFTERQIIRKEN